MAAAPLVHQLNAARGLAALVVLAGHLSQIFWLPMVGWSHGAVGPVATATRHAVLVFFLLSGYLIVAGMQRNVRDHGRFSAADFLWMRGSRLYPPLVGALVLTTAVVAALWAAGLPGSAAHPFAVLQPQPHIAPVVELHGAEIWTALLFWKGLENANPVFWSLYVEVRLYAIAALFAWGWTRRGAAGRATLATLATLAALTLLVTCVREDASFVAYAAVWLSGAAVALGDTRWRAWRQRLSWGVVVALIGIAWVRPGGLSILEPNRPLNLAVQGGLGLAYALLLFDLRWPRWASTLPARFAASAYTLYLTHWPLLLLCLALFQLQHGSGALWSIAAAAGAACLTLGVAAGLARGLEQPAWYRAWGHRLWVSMRDCASARRAARPKTEE